jgi:hypothetical protein
MGCDVTRTPTIETHKLRGGMGELGFASRRRVLVAVLGATALFDCRAFLTYPQKPMWLSGVPGHVVAGVSSLVRFVGRCQQCANLAPVTGDFRERRRQRNFVEAAKLVAYGNGGSAISGVVHKRFFELSSSGVADGVLLARVVGDVRAAKVPVGVLTDRQRLAWYALAITEFVASNIRVLYDENVWRQSTTLQSLVRVVPAVVMDGASDLTRELCDAGMRLLDGRPMTKREKWLYAGELVLRVLAIPERMPTIITDKPIECPLCFNDVPSRQLISHQPPKGAAHVIGCPACVSTLRPCGNYKELFECPNDRMILRFGDATPGKTIEGEVGGAVL